MTNLGHNASSDGTNGCKEIGNKAKEVASLNKRTRRLPVELSAAVTLVSIHFKTKSSN
jgi:hypothetical protein